MYFGGQKTTAEKQSLPLSCYKIGLSIHNGVYHYSQIMW